MSYRGTVVRPPVEDKPLTHYTLRYYPGTDLNKAKHPFTQVKVPFVDGKPSLIAWVQAEDHRLALPAGVSSLLEVVER